MIRFDHNAKFGKYRIIRELGRGGMGVVYKAKDTQLERTVALKLLHPAFALDATFTRRFRAEARAIAALNHPGIVHIHSLEESDGLMVIEMEYLAGGSLFDRLQWPAMSMDEAVIASSEILHALATCHASGIVHRDIKPSNILFGDDSRAVVSDFGLAKSIGSAWTGATGNSVTSSVAIGTPIYMPPEAWDDGEPEPSWDLYAMGVMMYQVIARTSPIDATTARGVVKELDAVEAPQLRTAVPNVSPALNDLVYALSARNIDSRIHEASEALDRLRLTAEYQRATANHPTPRRPLPIVPRRANFRPFLRRTMSSPVAQIFMLGLAVIISTGGIAVSSRTDRTDAVPEPSSSNAAVSGDSSEILDVVPGEFDVAAVHRGAFSAIYDTVIAETGETYTNHIGIHLREDEQEGILFAKTSKKLWYVHLKREPEQTLSMSGHWAHYEGDDNQFRHGTIEGYGRFRTRGVLLANLAFRDQETGESFTRTFTASHTQEIMSDTQFLLEAERVNELQPLLYGELLPRNLAWAREVEQIFPAIDGARIVVPFTPESVQVPVIDGRLDDAFWEYPAGARMNRIGVMLGEPGAIAPELNVRFTGDALYLSMRAFTDFRPETTGLDIALARQMSIPTWQSERWMYCYRGSATPYAIHRVHGDDVPWDSEWEIATHSEDQIWLAEVRIPYRSIGLSNPPTANDRWRLNVAVQDLSKSEPEQRYQWGYPVTLRVEHGVILQIRDSMPS